MLARHPSPGASNSRSLAATRWRAMGARSESEARGFFMNAVRKELSISFWTALARHRQNRLDFVGISRADVQRMRDQNQRGFGMGGRVRGRHGPVVAPGPRVAPPGWARPSDLRAFAAYQALTPPHRARARHATLSPCIQMTATLPSRSRPCGRIS